MSLAPRRDSYDSALPLFTESASKLTENPEVLFHLGMTRHKLGKTQEARESPPRTIELLYASCVYDPNVKAPRRQARFSKPLT